MVRLKSYLCLLYKHIFIILKLVFLLNFLVYFLFKKKLNQRYLFFCFSFIFILFCLWGYFTSVSQRVLFRISYHCLLFFSTGNNSLFELFLLLVKCDYYFSTGLVLLFVFFFLFIITDTYIHLFAKHRALLLYVE